LASKARLEPLQAREMGFALPKMQRDFGGYLRKDAAWVKGLQFVWFSILISLHLCKFWMKKAPNLWAPRGDA